MAGRRSLMKRAIQSQALCTDDFSWMDNQHQQSPCSVLAFVLAACQGGGKLLHIVLSSSLIRAYDFIDFTVFSLPDANHHYTPPNSTTANGCDWYVICLILNLPLTKTV